MTDYRLLIDLKTDRIIWFTNDKEAVLVPDSYSAIAEYIGSLPEGLTVTNCSNFIFRNKEIINTVKPQQKPLSLLEQNRVSILEYVTNTINNKLAKKLPIHEYSKFVDDLTVAEAKGILDGSITESKWLNITKLKLAIKSDREAAISVLQSREQFELSLFKLFELKAVYEKKVAQAVSNDELFNIKQEVTTTVGAI